MLYGAYNVNSYVYVTFNWHIKDGIMRESRWIVFGIINSGSERGGMWIAYVSVAVVEIDQCSSVVVQIYLNLVEME